MASRIRNHTSNDAALADARLVANNEAFAFLDIRDSKAKRVYLFCREESSELIDRATKAFRNVGVDVTVFPLEPIETLESRIAEISGQKGIELNTGLRCGLVGGLTLEDLAF